MLQPNLNTKINTDFGSECDGYCGVKSFENTPVQGQFKDYLKDLQV